MDAEYYYASTPTIGGRGIGMQAEPETVDERAVQQLRRYILAKHGRATLDAISPRREPPPSNRDTSKLDEQDRRLRLLERAIAAEKRAKELEAARRTAPPATAALLKWMADHPDNYGIQACRYGVLCLLEAFAAEWSDPAASGLDVDRAPSPGTTGDATTCGDSSAG